MRPLKTRTADSWNLSEEETIAYQAEVSITTALATGGLLPRLEVLVVPLGNVIALVLSYPDKAERHSPPRELLCIYVDLNQAPIPAKAKLHSSGKAHRTGGISVTYN